MIGLAGFTCYYAYRHHRVENMAYAALNVILACYAAKAFIGLRNSVVDACIHATSLLYKSKRRRIPRKARPQQCPPPTDWRSVLEVGFAEPCTALAQPSGRPGPGRHHRGRNHPASHGGASRHSGCSSPSSCWPAQDTAGTPASRRGWPAPEWSARRGSHPTWTSRSPRPTSSRTPRQTWPARPSWVSWWPTPAANCRPSWGAAYTLAQADQSLALSSRIAQMRQDGAQPIVSFGGQAHTSLDVACTSVTSLARAYQSAIDAYHLTAIDLDIEGPALDSFAASRRRAAAVADLEQTARAAHRQLGVWLTLPVEPSGLQDNAISVISLMLRDRVSIAGVNVMAMDFSKPPASGSTMLQSVAAALNGTHARLADLFPRYGIQLRSQQIWQRLGVTVMIGQNDLQGENFTVPDARGLVRFATANHLGRISMWSLNRDRQCGSWFPQSGLLSNTCSGTAQSGLEFSQVFGRLHGTTAVTSSAGNVQAAVANTNPADAPYPQWSATASYPSRYKVVENGEIYQATWFNSGDDPEAQVQYSWQTPWELLGPVLPGDHAPVGPRLPASTYPQWSITASYKAGEKVYFQNLPYVSKWDNQGVSPQAQSGSSADSPWKALYTVPGEPAGT